MKGVLSRVGWRRGVLTALVMVCCGGGAAFAAASAAAPGEISACADNASGVLRMAKGASDCKASESAVTWNKQGVQGVAGVKGDKGDTGATGAKGAAGAVGPMGAAGPKGEKGDKGATGATGAKGAAGAVGPMGATGPKGDKGATGATGARGAAGAVGPMGATGAKGDKGDTGATGAKGATGPQGLVGPQGPMGPEGPQGPEGPEGPQGPAVPVAVASDWPTPYDAGTGGAFYLSINGTVAPLKSFGGCRDQLTEFQDCYFQLDATAPVLDWISQTLALNDPATNVGGNGSVVSAALRSLEVIAVDANGKVSSRLRLGDSFWREAKLGDALASSKETLSLSLIVVPATVDQVADGGAFSPGKVARAPLASAFRVSVSGVDLRFVRQITGLAMSRVKLLKPRVGPNPPTHRGFEPGNLSFGQLTVSETRDDGLAELVDEALQDRTPLSGELTFLDASLKTEVFTLELTSLRPLGRVDAFPVAGARSVSLAVDDSEVTVR